MERDLLGLVDRTIVVVGAGGGGIGTAIACELARAGAHVTAVDVDRARLDLAVSAVASAGGHCTPEVVDARDGDAVDSLFDRADAGRGLFGLVNVVGGLPLDRWDRLLETPEDTLDAVLDTNVRVALRTSRGFAKRVSEREGEGAIVQIASIAAFHGMAYGAAYAASKAALISLARTMALEWGPFGIRVNCVAPGTVRAPGGGATDDAERDRATLPLGRRGDPEDIAGAVVFLVSDLARWVTGQVLAVDGGASAKPSYVDASGLPVFVTEPGLRSRFGGPESR